MHDITYWRTLQENKFQLPDDTDLATLTDELLFYLGSPNGELRDDIAYMAFAYWITEQDVYTLEQLRNLKDVLMMNLQIGIGEQGGNGVLFRSFSVLTLALIVYRDNQNSFLTNAEIAQILDNTLDYLQAEKDLRSYDTNKGWIHATAHTADALKFLARNEKSTQHQHYRILNALAEKITTEVDTIFCHSEDDRLARVVLDVMKRDLVGIAFYEQWLARFTVVTEAMKTQNGFDTAVYGAFQNTKNFLRALYAVVEFGTEEKPPVWVALRLHLGETVKQVGL